MQMKMIFPELRVEDVTSNISQKYTDVMKNSGLFNYGAKLEAWLSDDSSHSLGYSTHGLFRFFGKFPPPIARHLIQRYSKDEDLVIDPMCGSGTTAVEAVLLNRKLICFDINPLAVLLAKVKITYIPSDEYELYFNKILSNIKNIQQPSPEYCYLGQLKNSKHWFLEETIQSLGIIKQAISISDIPPEIKDVFMVIFLSIVRRVSNATNQQGRLFLDVETAEKNAIPFFINKAQKSRDMFSSVPESNESEIFRGSILKKEDLPLKKAPLIICHPPYFNNYKYSSINSLELAWMGENTDVLRKHEIREAFKVGKPEKVHDYIDDVQNALINLHEVLNGDGVLALMIGDTIMKEQYIPVTSMILDGLKKHYDIENIAFRIPKYTEASWAASLRRKKSQLGVNMCDYVISLRKI
jgi:DNA modification methylase